MLKLVNIINGINTDAGKTFTCYNIIKHFNQLYKQKVNYIKPVISGFEEESIELSDAGKILSLFHEKITVNQVKNITRYLLKMPASPNIAAKKEGIVLDYQSILDFCNQKIQNSMLLKQPIIIEMSGGLCSPLTDSKTMLDLTKDITNKYKGDCKNFLISCNYLGAISHTITANMIFEFDEVIFNPYPNTENAEEVINTLQNFGIKTQVLF